MSHIYGLGVELKLRVSRVLPHMEKSHVKYKI
jgi:hypothetical protein